VIVNIIFCLISKCGSELCYFNYKMSSGPSNKRIKKILTDTQQLKVSNFFSSKRLDAATAANSKRPTDYCTEQSSSLGFVNGVFDDNDISNVPYDGDCLSACLAVGLAKDSALQVRKKVVSYLRQHPDTVRISSRLSYICVSFCNRNKSS